MQDHNAVKINDSVEMMGDRNDSTVREVFANNGLIDCVSLDINALRA